MKISLKRTRDYIYLFLLFGISGNPMFYGKGFFIILTVLLVILHYQKLLLVESQVFYLFIGFFTIIFLLQYKVLNFVSLPGVLGFLLKFVLGYIIIASIGKEFKYIYFNLIFFISLISLIGYISNLADINFPAKVTYDPEFRNSIIFTQKHDGLRNSGMFWEPGAFACYISLGFLLFIGNIHDLQKFGPLKLIIVVFALLTTFSTTGYIVFFILLILALIDLIYGKNLIVIIALIVAFSIGAKVIYERSEFLHKKIVSQIGQAQELEGEYTGNRIGVFVFDIHYIKKHPLIGNGIHEKTRYADHPILFGEKLHHGNGFSNFLASMGFLSLIFYSYHIIKYRKRSKWLFLLILFIILQGEPLMNFPLFLSLPFILYFDENDSRTSNLPQ